MVAARLHRGASRCDHVAMPRLLVLLVVVALAGCGGNGGAVKTEQASVTTKFAGGTVEIATAGGTVTVPVEVADTEAKRELGLMHRTSLPANEGMVFVFASEQTGVGFWMKDTLIPLSVAFADGDGTIVAILDMEPCKADPCEVYDPGAPFQTALEVNKGAFADWGVEVGDTLNVAG
jgi:uncharacterized protein